MLARCGVRAASAVAGVRRCASTLVVVEHDGVAIAPASLSAVTAASQVGGPVSVLVAGPGSSGAAEAASKIAGVDEVLHAESDALEGGLAENMAATISAVQADKSFTHIFANASNYGKNFIPRVAAGLDVAPLTDIMSVEDENTFTRPMYAGNAIVKAASSDAVKVATVRTTNFEKAAADGGSAGVVAVDAVDAGLSSYVGEEKVKSDRPELTEASVVVTGGRGFKSGENFDILYKLADKMGAAVGASRAAVDAWPDQVPNDMQVGQTGKVIAPDLYIGFGVSGAIQHLAGMKDSKVIAVVNKDPEAPFFQVADYGLVADLFEAIPEMEGKL